jgi:GH24 family phage-related lysozyme (muramidase)
MQADCLTIARRIIIEGEGKKLKRYTDSKGHATIGIGHKIKNGEGLGESIT